MSVARPMGWFLILTSDPRAKESEVHGWRLCESFLPSLSSIAAWHQLVMHLVRAAYTPKRKLPYPSACCVHCPIPVSGTRGTREQRQVLTVVVGHLETSYQIVAGCREYLTGLVRVTPKVDAIGKRVGFAGIEAAVIPNPEEICRKMRLRFWPCTDDSNSQCIRGGYSSGAVSPSISAAQLSTDAELERPTKHRRDQILFPSGSLCAEHQGQRAASH